MVVDDPFRLDCGLENVRKEREAAHIQDVKAGR
jgi:hypothetical protein